MDILNTIGILAALASAASWAIGSILFKKIGESVPPLGMTLAKGLLASLLLFPFIFLFDIFSLSLTNLFYLIVSGVLGIAIGDTLFFLALSRLSAHTLIMFMMLGQIMTVGIAVIFLGEHPSLKTWLALGIILIGVYIVLYTNIWHDENIKPEVKPKNDNALSEDKLLLNTLSKDTLLQSSLLKSKFHGMIFATLSMICMSVSVIIAKPALETTSSLFATFIRMVAGTVGVAFVGAMNGHLGLWIKSVNNKEMAFHFFRATTVITFGGFWLFLFAIKYCDVSIANTLGSTEPIFILIFAWILYKEKPSLLQIIGTAVAVGGAALLFWN